MHHALTEMPKSEMVEILRGFDTMDADSTARQTWDAFTLGSEDQVGLLESSDEDDIVSWEAFPRKILAKAIREAEIIFRDSIDVEGNVYNDADDIIAVQDDTEIGLDIEMEPDEEIVGEPESDEIDIELTDSEDVDLGDVEIEADEEDVVDYEEEDVEANLPVATPPKSAAQISSAIGSGD